MNTREIYMQMKDDPADNVISAIVRSVIVML